MVLLEFDPRRRFVLAWMFFFFLAVPENINFLRKSRSVIESRHKRASPLPFPYNMVHQKVQSTPYSGTELMFCAPLHNLATYRDKQDIQPNILQSQTSRRGGSATPVTLWLKACPKDSSRSEGGHSFIPTMGRLNVCPKTSCWKSTTSTTLTTTSRRISSAGGACQIKHEGSTCRTVRCDARAKAR